MLVFGFVVVLLVKVLTRKVCDTRCTERVSLLIYGGIFRGRETMRKLNCGVIRVATTMGLNLGRITIHIGILWAGIWIGLSLGPYFQTVIRKWAGYDTILT